MVLGLRPATESKAAIGVIRVRHDVFGQPDIAVLRLRSYRCVIYGDRNFLEIDHENAFRQIRFDVHHLTRVCCDPGAALETEGTKFRSVDTVRLNFRRGFHC